MVFGLGSKCTHPLKFVPNCFVDSNSIAGEWLGHEMLPTYAGGNTQQNGSPVLVQVIYCWRHVPLSYGLKFDDVNDVLKALLEAITRRPVQYLEGGLEVHYSVISGAVGETSMMEKLKKWIQFDYPPVFHSGSGQHFSLMTL
ncbi:hypothetical protein Y032_0108g64 [Ancylostoma ceylanicum]|uniref:Uncharacterized protein n=1 Tax=Ancylostoma ceylanicum TaxID=53326 RepID=A0A016TF82_9BILA|nr:hypothetical protein Y032_0108g64 [Ancylostoma ceylanicum]